MTTETILKPAHLHKIIEQHPIAGTPQILDLMISTEQAVLESPEIQSLRKDAERWRKAASHVFEIKQTHEPVGENRIRRLQIDLRKSSTSTTKWLN